MWKIEWRSNGLYIGQMLLGTVTTCTEADESKYYEANIHEYRSNWRTIECKSHAEAVAAVEAAFK